MQPSAISSIYNTTVISTLENAGYKRHDYYWAGLHARYRQKAGANKSPKNASAARFLGLCCYQSRSEKDGFRGIGSGGKAVCGQALEIGRLLNPFLGHIQRCQLLHLAKRMRPGTEPDPEAASRPAGARRFCARGQTASRAAALKCRSRFIARSQRLQRWIHCKSRSKLKPRKIAPLHGFWGFAAIEEGAEKDGFQGGGQRRRNRLRAGAGKPRKLAPSPSGPHLSRSRVGRGGVHVRTAPFTPANGNESLFSRPAPSPPASQTQPRPDAFSLLF